MKKIQLFLIIILFMSIPKNGIAQNFPDKEWKHNAQPVFSGWDQSRLDLLKNYVIDSTSTTGMMIIHDGEVIFEYGNVIENSYIASCRKSILAMLYGKHVVNGTIDLTMTLADIKIDENKLLLEQEKRATIKDIISSRSGIFLPAANGGDMQHLAPERGSVKPGELWVYNNWDFNMAGHIFEKITNRNIYDEIETQFAIPLKMQDWDRSLQQKDGNHTLTDILAYHMWFSTRDMARLGLLMLNKGKWENKQIIDEKWINEMVTPKSTFDELDKIAPFLKKSGRTDSYGYMWWLLEDTNNRQLKGAYSAQGAYGQNITVLPEMNTVLVIKTNNLYERQNGNHNYIINEITKSFDSGLSNTYKVLKNSVQENDMTQFIKEFKKIKKQNIKFDIQDVLNKIGYHYLTTKDYNSSIQIFKFNIEKYPNSWNVYDSLGEAYFLSGNLESALMNYKKALALNVENQYNHNTKIKHIINRLKLKLKDSKK